MKKIIACLAALAFATPAFADEPPVDRYSGCYVGAIGGYSLMSADTTLDAPGIPASLNFGDLAAKGFSYGGIAGCDMKLGTSGFIVGGFADYQFKDLQHQTTLTIGPNSGNASFGVGDAWTVGGRLGFLVNPDTLVYGLVGYTQAKSHGLSVTDGINSAEFSIGDLKGYVIGGGIEAYIKAGFSIRGEYRYTKYDGVGMELIPGALNFNSDLEEHAGMVSLVYRFGK